MVSFFDFFYYKRSGNLWQRNSKKKFENLLNPSSYLFDERIAEVWKNIKSHDGRANAKYAA